MICIAKLLPYFNKKNPVTVVDKGQTEKLNRFDYSSLEI